MRVVVLADVHAHKHSQFSHPDTEFGTNRVRHIVSCLGQARDYAVTNQIKYVIIVGDLFHSRGILSVEVNNIVRDSIKTMKNVGLDVIIVAGNHDQANKSGSITSVRGVEEYADAIEDFTIMDSIAYMPYSDYRAEVVEWFQECRVRKVKQVFAHIPVAGAELVKGYTSSSGYEITLEEIQPEAFQFVAMGHYHKPQLLANNVFYVGSLLHHSFADVGQDKGFWDITFNSDKYKATFVPTEFPWFVEYVIPNKKGLVRFLKDYVPEYFYKLKLNSELDFPEDLDNVLIERVVKDVEFAPRLRAVEQAQKPIEVVDAYLGYKNIAEPERYLKYATSVFDRLKANIVD